MCVHVSAFLIADMCGGWGCSKGDGVRIHGFALYGVFVILLEGGTERINMQWVLGASLNIPEGMMQLRKLHLIPYYISIALSPLNP